MSVVDRDQAIKAVDAAFDTSVNRLFEIFIEGLEIGTPAETLGDRFRRGLAFACDAHGKTTAILENYFSGFKP